MKMIEGENVLSGTELAVAGPRSISRRNLLRGAASVVTMGAMRLLPMIEVPGQEEPVAGFLASKTALAEENFVITIVSKTEVGINVVDVANGNAPVKGATVTITSRFPKAKVKSRSAVTGEDFTDPEDMGKVIIDIADLSETDDKGNPVDGRYEFNGSISVIRKAGNGLPAMRDFSTGIVRVKGASALEISSHAMDDLQFYPERITFNDWDMHYQVPTFWRSKVNKSDEQTILIRFAGCSDTVDVSISDHDVGNWPRTSAGELTTQATYDDDSGYYVATFKGPFLCTEKSIHKGLGMLDDDYEFDIAYTYKGTTYHTYQKFHTKEAPIDTATLANSFDPISMDSSTYTVPFPGDFPFFKDFSAGLKIPDIPFYVSATPTRITLGVNTARDLLKDDTGKAKTKPEEIEMDEMSAIEDQEDDSRAEADQDAEEAIANQDVGVGGADGPSGKKSLFNRAPLAKNIEFNAGFEGYLMLDWKGLVEDPTKGYLVKHFDGALLVGVGISVKGTVCQQVAVAFVPLYAAFSLEFSMQTSIRGGASIMTETSVVDVPLNQTHVDFDVAAPVFNIALAGTLTIGAGVKDVISLGIAGTGTLQLYIAALSKKMIAEGRDVPHVVFGGKFVVEIFLELMVLKVSTTFWSVEDKRIYDSWPDSSSLGVRKGDDVFDYEPRFRLRQPDGSLRHSVVYTLSDDGSPMLLAGNGDNIFDNLQIVTEKDDLVKTIEFEGKAEVGGIPVTGADEDKSELLMDKSPAFIRQEDGSYKIEIVDRAGSVTIVVPDESDEDLEPQAEEVAEIEDTPMEEQIAEEESGLSDASEDSLDSAVNEEVFATEDETAPTDDLAAMAAAAATSEALGEMAADAAEGDVVVDEGVVVEPMAEEDVAALAEQLPSSESAELDVAEATKPTEEVGQEANSEAGVPAELEAQAEPDPEGETDPDADLHQGLGESHWKHPGLGFVEPVSEEAAYVYSPVCKTESYSLPESDVAGFAPNGGITPHPDTVINDGVFSDPRQRIITINDTPYLFRILTVKLDTPDDGFVLRSRLSASKYIFDTPKSGHWDTPKVINFTCDTGDLSRYKIFDYDFDIIVRPNGVQWYKGSTIGIVMTGGMRPYGDDQDHLYDIFASPTITVLFLDANLNVVTRSVRMADAYLGTDQVHMVHCPHIVDRFTPDGSSGVFAFTFVHRSSDEPKKLMTSDAHVAFSVGTCASLPNMRSFDVKVGGAQALDASVHEVQMVVGKAISGFCQQSVSILALYPQGYDVHTAYIEENQAFSDILYRRNIHNTSDSLPNLVAWPGHSAFLYTRPGLQGEADNPHLYAGTFDMTVKDAGAFTEEQVDLEGFKGTSFGVSPSGNYLFFYETRDGWAGDEIDPNSGESTGSTSKTIYRIKASKFVGDKFCEDFTFCELDHPVDSLVPLTLNGDANTFIASQVIDAEHSIACLRYIAVPHIFAATVESFRTLDDFALAGKPCTFKMTVRNHGNMIIRGFSVDIIDLDDHDNVIETVEVGEIKPSQILVGLENYDWVNPGQERDEDAYHLSEALQDGALMPGAALTYPLPMKMIPDYWGDKKPGEKHATRNVHLHIHDEWGEDYSLASQEENTGHRFVEPITSDMHFGRSLNGGTDGIVNIHVAEGRGSFYDPEERWEKKKDDPDNPNGGGGKLPQTDDPYRADTVLGLALGGFGSLMAGYSARRLAVEREEAETQGRHGARYGS